MPVRSIQNQVAQFVAEHHLSTDVATRVLDLTSEVGELAKEVLKGSAYGTNAFVTPSNWESELGDVLFALICVANASNTDLAQALNSALKKYQARFTSK